MSSVTKQGGGAAAPIDPATAHKAEQAVMGATMRLMFSHGFYSALVLSMRREASAAIETMATDGRTLYYNPDWTLTLTPQEIAGVLAHEGLHKGLAHHTRMTHDPADAMLWNIAFDLAINEILLQEDARHIALPKGGVTLATIAPQLKAKGCPQTVIDSLKTADAERAFTVLKRWLADDQGKGQSGPTWGQVLPWPGEDGAGDPTADDLSVEAAACGDLLAQAVEAGKSRGTVPGAFAEMVRAGRNPGVDLREFLSLTVAGENPYDWTWRKPSRRHEEYLPSVERRSTGYTLAFVDTSGSVSTAELSVFTAILSDVSEQVRPDRLVIVPVDSRVQTGAIVEYRHGEAIPELKAQGRGGTDFRDAFRWLAEQEDQPDRVIYLTDMEAPFPDAPPDMPVAWLATTDAKAPWGETYRVRI